MGFGDLDFGDLDFGDLYFGDLDFGDLDFGDWGFWLCGVLVIMKCDNIIFINCNLYWMYIVSVVNRFIFIVCRKKICIKMMIMCKKGFSLYI